MHPENKKTGTILCKVILNFCSDVKAEFPLKLATKLVVYKRTSVVSLKPGNLFSLFYEHFRNIIYRAALRSTQKRFIQKTYPFM